MNKENDYYKGIRNGGIMIGLAVGIIICSLLWMLLIGKINRIHKQEIDYIIEKHQTK